MSSLPRRSARAFLLSRRARPSRLGALLLAALLAGCAGLPGDADAPDAPVARRVDALLPVDALLLGEQHDAADHHRIERETVEALAARGRLAALALEMAEEGNAAAHLPATATEAQVRTALSWSDAAWPWADYGPAVMAAVRAGVPVIGANLPRARMKDAMADVSLDAQLDAPAYAAQQEAVRDGHCGMLPASQILPMTRIQVGRDRAMAQAVVKARQPGRTVLLIAGAGHVDRRLGVAQHLPAEVSVKAVRLLAAPPDAEVAAGDYDRTWRTPPLPEKDYCAEFRRQMPPPRKDAR